MHGKNRSACVVVQKRITKTQVLSGHHCPQIQPTGSTTADGIHIRLSLPAIDGSAPASIAAAAAGMGGGDAFLPFVAAALGGPSADESFHSLSGMMKRSNDAAAATRTGTVKLRLSHRLQRPSHTHSGTTSKLRLPYIYHSNL